METDVLIIGSGVAGLNCALKAARYGKVALATKDILLESNTFYAQGGCAAVFGDDDLPELHVQDTLRAGDGLSNEKRVRILVEEAPKEILELQKLGVQFDALNDKLLLSREAVHSRARIVHTSDKTGEEIEKVLAKRVVENKEIHVLEHCTAIELIIDNNACIGCIFIHEEKSTAIFAKKIILATGGIGQIYSKTTNPAIATGDGITLAFNAGCALEDMEFVQFHPTMLHDSTPSFLISETLRGEGGILKNKFDKAYMKKYHRDGELAPRDVVARFSWIEMKKTDSRFVSLDMTHFDQIYLKKRFPYIYNECLKYGIDITKDEIPVSPAAHYLCGGIKTDEYGRTTVKNLYAIGECACTQIHGADRLASNSMTEGLVFGSRLVEKIKEEIRNEKVIIKEIREMNLTENKNIDRYKKKIQDIMWHDVGIIRTKEGLKKAEKELAEISSDIAKMRIRGINRPLFEIYSMCLVSQIITYSAQNRRESRGTHYITDYPQRDDKEMDSHLFFNKNSCTFY